MAKQSSLDIFSGGFANVLEEQWQVDVELKAGDSDQGESISAHKLVLAARSKVFRKMLEKDEYKTSSRKEIITLSEMKHKEVKALVEFMYSNNGSKTYANHARPLYIAADKYEIPLLRDLCRTELISSLDSTNSISVLELAQIPFDKALHDAAVSCIKKNKTTIVNSDEFKLLACGNPNLTVETLKEIFNRSKTGNGYSYCHSCGRC